MITPEPLKTLKQMIDVLLKTGQFTKEQVSETLFKLREIAISDIDYVVKIEELISQSKEGHANMAEELENWINVTEGLLSVTDAYKELHIVTAEEKRNARVIFHRLKEKGIIAPTGQRAGQYRRIDATFEPLTDFSSEDTQEVHLSFPLGLERFSKVFQSNIVVIAGEKDCGKTGFCLNFATINRGNGHKIRYISSEFGAAELRERLEPMDLDPNQWIRDVEFGQFQRNTVEDVIDPDAINIVDFLESTEGQFYMVSEQIKKIYQKLRGGVALIALQKKIGSEYARGGELSAEKARLYVTLGRRTGDGPPKNIATILHCKNRAIPEINPNGLQCEYRLGGGWYFKRQTEWLPR